MLVMNILLLIGSGDGNSHSLHLGQAIEAELKSQGAETEIINLVEYDLPLYSRQVERDQAHDKKTQAFLEKSRAADGFVWITPIYHNSFSAILKNALDWQHPKFPDKVVGMASHGGHRSAQAVDQLMMVARAQHAVAARIRVCTQDSDYDDNMNVSEPIIKDRIAEFATEMVDSIKRMQAKN
jgi:NAD(P)H-dependent FMN reductase